MNKLYDESSIQAIANAIRNKNDSSDTYTVSQMSSAVDNIPSGGTPTINNGKNNFWVYIDTANTSVSITVETVGDTIDWGDSTVDTDTSHTYINAGVYWIKGNSISAISVGGILYGGNIIYAEYNNAVTLPSYNSNTTLKKIVLNNSSFTTLAASTFSDCTSLIEIDMPYITRIIRNTFKRCTALTNINLSNVQEILPGAFRSCTSLSGHLDISKATLIGYGESSDNGAFMGCTGITSVTIGAVEPYDSSKRNAAFQYCTGLTTATILGGTSTGRATFNRCTSLRTVYLPDTITEIGLYAFGYNSNLTLYIRATTPPNILNYAFRSAGISAIYVPAESVETYKTASGWSTYASIIQAEPTT